MILIDAERLAASRPNRPLFADVSVTISDGDRLGVVGLNGSRQEHAAADAGRRAAAEAGEVRWGRGARVGFLLRTRCCRPAPVREAVGGGWQGEAMLDRLGMTPLLDAPTDELSGGQAKRVALARLLVGEYDVLILDEPTNHLDLDAIPFLEEWLAAYRGGLVLVTHDRHVLDRVTTKVLELDRGRRTSTCRRAGTRARATPRTSPAGRARGAGRGRRTGPQEPGPRELAWLRRGAPARTPKPKARIATATALVEGKAQAAARDGELGLAMGSQAARVEGDRADATSRSRGRTARAVLDPCSLAFEPGDRLGIVGANGAGKSTLLDLIAGRLAPTAGTVERGATVQLGYYDQLGRDLDLDPAGARRGRRRQGRAVAGRRRPDAAVLVRRRCPVRADRHAERRRAPPPAAAAHAVPQPNVLLLDEPTNDLDLDTLRALEDFLDDWPGIVVAVSHDRAFLDRVTDELLALDGDGGVRWIRGGVAAWLAQRAARRRRRGRPPTLSLPKPPAPRRGNVAAAAARRGRSPSTVRRQLGQAERDLAAATART